ncbi:hypothetical protein BJP25_09795 [Actinokineospora bangkokensis]|uniref:Uncharacterized protein n=1 Tax=Actinokineospora bangkokensis TaxID=1193682 RepID=A0A1Q9LRL6_9PSEU|nr:hypothetical protein BJP25_09795 [Actinokineospora bangkokensis]
MRFSAEPPPQQQRNPALLWALRIGGLVAIAVVSGLVWTYIQSDSTGGGTEAGPTDASRAPVEGRYEFTPYRGVPQPRVDTDCAAHSYGKVQELMRSTPCESLTRGLYSTTVDGKAIVVSVSAVRMRTPAEAQALRELSEKSGTGNVNDLVRDKAVSIPGLTALSANDGFFVQNEGQTVIIAEADFEVNGKSYKGNATAEKTLDGVCEDAMRLGEGMG